MSKIFQKKNVVPPLLYTGWKMYRLPAIIDWLEYDFMTSIYLYLLGIVIEIGFDDEIFHKAMKC